MRNKIFSIVGILIITLSQMACSEYLIKSKKEPPKVAQVKDLAAEEPAYCDPATFDLKEIDPLTGKTFEGSNFAQFKAREKSGLENVHTYRLGKVVFAGLAVGKSKPKAVEDLAKRFSNAGEKKNFCTWYLNHPSEGSSHLGYQNIAKKKFNHKDINKNPRDMDEQQAITEFMGTLEQSFDQSPLSFLSCADENKYIAVGCNSMAHRGPTVFGMILAFSGCKPEHALEISNQIWALNGVKRSVRLAVIQKAYDLGSAHRDSREQLADLFSGM